MSLSSKKLPWVAPVLLATQLSCGSELDKQPPLPTSENPTALVDTLNQCRDIWKCRVLICDPTASENVPTSSTYPFGEDGAPVTMTTANLCNFRTTVSCQLQPTDDDRWASLGEIFAETEFRSYDFTVLSFSDDDLLAGKKVYTPWTAGFCDEISPALTELQHKIAQPHRSLNSPSAPITEGN
jgi:hypothetical protein